MEKIEHWLAIALFAGFVIWRISMPVRGFLSQYRRANDGSTPQQSELQTLFSDPETSKQEDVAGVQTLFSGEK